MEYFFPDHQKLKFLQMMKKREDYEIFEAAASSNITDLLNLLESGVDANYCNLFGKTPLLEAVRYNRLGNARHLLSCGAEVNVTEPDYINFLEQNTPLHFAAFHGNLEMVQMLVEHGANIHAISYYRSPLLIACGSLEESTWTLTASEIGEDRFESWSGFNVERSIKSSEYFHEPVVEFLINQGANIHVADYNGRTALDMACQAGRSQMVATLLKRGAMLQKDTLVRAFDSDNETIIEMILQACRSQSPPMTRISTEESSFKWIDTTKPPPNMVVLEGACAWGMIDSYQRMDERFVDGYEASTSNGNVTRQGAIPQMPRKNQMVEKRPVKGSDTAVFKSNGTAQSPQLHQLDAKETEILYSPSTSKGAIPQIPKKNQMDEKRVKGSNSTDSKWNDTTQRHFGNEKTAEDFPKEFNRVFRRSKSNLQFSQSQKLDVKKMKSFYSPSTSKGATPQIPRKNQMDERCVQRPNSTISKWNDTNQRHFGNKQTAEGYPKEFNRVFRRSKSNLQSSQLQQLDTKKNERFYSPSTSKGAISRIPKKNQMDERLVKGSNSTVSKWNDNTQRHFGNEKTVKDFSKEFNRVFRRSKSNLQSSQLQQLDTKKNERFYSPSTSKGAIPRIPKKNQMDERLVKGSNSTDSKWNDSTQRHFGKKQTDKDFPKEFNRVFRRSKSNLQFSQSQKLDVKKMKSFYTPSTSKGATPQIPRKNQMDERCVQRPNSTVSKWNDTNQRRFGKEKTAEGYPKEFHHVFRRSKSNLQFSQSQKLDAKVIESFHSPSNKKMDERLVNTTQRGFGNEQTAEEVPKDFDRVVGGSHRSIRSPQLKQMGVNLTGSELDESFRKEFDSLALRKNQGTQPELWNQSLVIDLMEIFPHLAVKDYDNIESPVWKQMNVNGMESFESLTFETVQLPPTKEEIDEMFDTFILGKNVEPVKFCGSPILGRNGDTSSPSRTN